MGARHALGAMLTMALAFGCDAPADAPPPVALIDDGGVRGDGEAVEVVVDAAVDAQPPARALVESPPLPIALDNRMINPVMSPFGGNSWFVYPDGQATRVFDHRLPFAGPALQIGAVDDRRPELFARLALAAEPLAIEVWLGVNRAPGRALDAQHDERVGAEVLAFTPDESVRSVLDYDLRATGEATLGPRGRVWRRYAGTIEARTLGIGWLVVYAAGGVEVSVGAPQVRAVPVEPAALRVLDPAMVGGPPDPARLARLAALQRRSPDRMRRAPLDPSGR